MREGEKRRVSGIPMKRPTRRPSQNRVNERLATVSLALNVSSWNFGSHTLRFDSAPTYMKEAPTIPQSSPGLKVATRRR